MTTGSFLLIPLAAAAGWCAGLVSDRLTHQLLARDGLAAPVATRRGLLWGDPLVQATLALLWGAFAARGAGPGWRWLEAGALAVPLVQVAVTDLRHRYVYTLVAAGGAGLGLLLGPSFHAAAWWASLAGAAVGCFSFGLLYAVGRALYREAEPLARGDVTIAAMVGAIAGPRVAQALLAGVVLSGLLAAGVLLARRSRRATMPYGPGLCLGGLLTLLFP